MPKDDSPKKPHRKTVPGVYVLRDHSSTSQQNSKVYKSIEALRWGRSEPPSPPPSPTKAPQFFHIVDRSPTPEPLSDPSSKPHPERYFLPTDIFDVEPTALSSGPTPPSEANQPTASHEPLAWDTTLLDTDLIEMAEVGLDSAGIEEQLVRCTRSIDTGLDIKVLTITTQRLPIELF